MVRDKHYVSDYEEEIDYLDKILKQEDTAIANPAVANVVSSQERMKADLMARKTKLQQQLAEIEKKIEKLDGSIALKKAGPG